MIIHVRLELGRHYVRCNLPIAVPARSIDGRHIRLAQPRRRLHQRIEHRLQIEGRSADHLEHVGGGGLLREGLPQLVEQPGVLYGDDGLVGEILDQLDLLVGERTDLLAVDDEAADPFALFEQRRKHRRACATELDGGHRARVALDIVRIIPHIVDMDDASGRQGSDRAGARTHASKGLTLPQFGERRRQIVNRDGAVSIAPSFSHSTPNLAPQMRTAFASMASNTGASSPGELEMTPSTSEVAVCCSSDSLSSSVRACTSSNSRTFSMAITAWSAKV